MKIGIIVAELPGDDPAGLEVIGQPAPYRAALDTYGELINDPEVAAKYTGISLWTRHGVAKKRKLKGAASVAAAAEPAPAPEKKEREKTSKKAAPKKRAAPKNND
jgi:hypothetical protein